MPKPFELEQLRKAIKSTIHYIDPGEIQTRHFASEELKVLVVVHCIKDENNEIRIISARKASKNEQKQYGGYLL